MKYFLFSGLLLLTINSVWAQHNTAKLLASCCDKGGRGCTGSDYCTACTNCSGCKHCSSGGSCGVCRDKSPEVVEYKRKEKKTPTGSKVKTVTITRTPKFYSGQPIFITTMFITLREGPGNHYKILETVKKGERIIFQENRKPWIKVKAEKSGTIGYVHQDVLE